jgi:hypothetical protein
MQPMKSPPLCSRTVKLLRFSYAEKSEERKVEITARKRQNCKNCIKFTDMAGEKRQICVWNQALAQLFPMTSPLIREY